MALDLPRDIQTRNVEQLLSELFFESVPHLFGGDLPLYRSWREELASGLGVDPNEIVIIGSAATGYSLRPTGNLKAFDASSDVDVAVVSERHFSEAWHHLRNIDLTLAPITPAQRAALLAHKENYIYWGCIATDRILPILPFE